MPFAPDVLSPAHDAALSECERELIHLPGAIQPHGALIAANSETLRVTHVSANLPERLLGQSLPSAIGRQASSVVLHALAETRYAISPVCAAHLPGSPEMNCDITAHRLDDAIVIEFEPEAPPGESTAIVAQAQSVIDAMRRSRSRQELCEVAVEALRRLTGFDRVMAYRFDAALNGAVIAESCADGLEPYLGLHYPATDIPAQARRLYLQQRLRAIADVRYTPVRIVTDASLPPGSPLDMSFCTLRSVSPVHLEYLKNMGVAATLAISLVQDNALWGMLICHHTTPRLVSAGMRALCDLIGQLASLLVTAKGQNETIGERLRRSESLDAMNERALGASSVVQALLHTPEDLLRLVNADGALVQLAGKSHLIGKTPALVAANAIAKACREQEPNRVFSTENIAGTFPAYGDHEGIAAGVLHVPLLQGSDDCIAWFRQEVPRDVVWAGDPEKAKTGEDGRLTPRKSFDAWQTRMRGYCKPWQEVDVALAYDLRRIVTSIAMRLMEQQARLANLRYYDGLTNLPNRRMLQERLEAISAAAADGVTALIFVDLDRFKTVNDSLGHAVGDELLVQVANRLLETVPADHVIARLGGDEFAILMEQSSSHAAQDIADLLLAAFHRPFLLAGRPYRMTASIGVACSGQPRDVLRAADTAMYAAKRAGGDRAANYDETLQSDMASRLELEQDLYLALERNEFALHYQPIVSAATRRVLGVEALLRWRRPAHGLVPPGDFIPIAEETGLMVPIGEWVLREATAALKRWRTRFNPRLIVSVNASATQCNRPAFRDEVRTALEAAALPPQALLLEITESVLMSEAALAHIQALHASGVRVAVDDFGTGYSSLAYLRDLPVDELKIDQRFVAGLCEDRRQAALIRIMIELAHALSLQVIAEGVETEAQMEALATLRCDALQGYGIARPLTEEDMDRLLASQPEAAQAD